MTNSEITAAARKKLDGKWLHAIIAFLITSILSSINIFTKDSFDIPFDLPFGETFSYLPSYFIHDIHFNLGYLSNILLGGAFAYGQAVIGLTLIREDKLELELIFSGFKNLNRYFVFLATSLIITIFTIAWMLLLIIPGIIAALSYSMTFYILVDQPHLSSLEAIQQSKILMKGHKWQLFTLYLRFIGLGILCILTLGIGFLWLVPYANICLAQFYEQLVAELDSTDIY